jgi:PAS domain S-box-containing protein
VTVDLTLAAPCEEEEVPRILELTAGPLHHDAPGAALLTMRDVTRERITAVELVKTKEFLERVIEHSVDAIISADLEGTVLLFNPAAERAYGFDARDVIGKMNVRALYPAGEAESIMRLIRSDEGGTGRLSGHRTEMVGKTGERIPVSLSAALIFERGKPIGSVGIFTDLRERLRMEARLTEAREELRSREKQALIAELAGAAAHELNQPLTSVLGYAEIIAKKTSRSMPVDAETAIIVREAERMAEIVRKIGRITKYETKSYVGAAKIIDLDRSSVDPNEGLR